MNPTGDPPRGAPLAAFVEGILDGRVADAATLREAAERLGRTGAGPFRCDIQGGRFSLLPVDTEIPPGFDAAAQARFLAALQHLLDGARPGSVESNLRCRLLYADEIVETLFVVRGQAIEPLTRRRPRADSDPLPSAPDGAALPLGLRRREVLWLLPLLLIAGLGLAWQAGWIDRVLAARAEDLRRNPGPFQDMLAIDVARSWGDYEATLRRGEGYPATLPALDARRAAATTPEERLAVGIVGDGRELFVQLLAADGQLLAETRADLRPLLANPEGSVAARLPGRIGAAAVRLSTVAAGKPR